MFGDVTVEEAGELPAVLASFMRLRRENDLLVAMIARSHGLTASDFRALTYLRITALPTPRRLAEHLALSLGATTAMVDRLVEAGFVRRVPNPDDGRSVHLETTESGASAVDGSTAVYTAAFDQALSPEHQATVAAAFDELAAALAARVGAGAAD